VESGIYRSRLIDRPLADMLRTEPAVMIVGPRNCGKSTTAARHAASTAQLDAPAASAAFHADPDAALARMARPALLDEWQEVPAVLGAVKHSVDAGAPPGSFLITGSVDASVLGLSVPTFGRTQSLVLWPANQREIGGSLTESSTPFPDMLVTGDIDQWRTTEQLWRVEDYFRATVTGGYPTVAFADQPNPKRLNGLATDIVASEATRISPRLAASKLSRWLRANAEQTARQPPMETLLDIANINRRTGDRYDELLTQMFILQLVPGWYSNRLKRLTKTPQRHIADTGVCAAILGASVDDLLDDPHLGGHLLASFVAEQVRPEVSLNPHTNMFHWRTDDGKEVDLVIEHRKKLFGIEIIRSVNPFNTRDPAATRKIRHLQAMRNDLGKMFGFGVVFYPGEALGMLDTNIIAAPISCLWS